MAKNRYVNTKFWDDSFIMELNTTEKLLFLYLLTNPLTNIAGVYEITPKRISFDTGISSSMLQKILKKFGEADRIYYHGQHIFIKNFIKHQQNNPKIHAGIQNFLKSPPEIVSAYVTEDKDRLYIDYDKLRKALNYFNSNLNLNLNLNSNSNSVLHRLSKPSSLSDSFEIFWKNHPGTKTGKKKCYEKWLVINPDQKLFDKIMCAIENQKTWRARAKPDEFRPEWKNPLTWLNQECWEDEIEASKPEDIRECDNCHKTFDYNKTKHCPHPNCGAEWKS